MLQAEKCLQKHSSGHHSGFKGTSLPRPSSETLAVSNPLKDICFENLPENLPRSIRDLARDLRPAEKPHIDLYRTQEIKPKSGFSWHKAKDYLKRLISQWDKSKCRCKDNYHAKKAQPQRGNINF